jgi:hypothetical protein
LYVNGTPVVNAGGKLGTIAGCQATGNIGRGYNNNTFYAGDIAEVLIYSRALTTTERQQVEQILNNKYALATSTPPFITQQPTNVIVAQGGGAIFSVTATGTERLAYQWRFNGGAIGGATASSYTINNAQSSHAGNYQVVVSNSFGMVTSAVAVLAVNVTIPPLNGLAVWLRADAGTVINGSGLSQWMDQSGNNRNATQSTGASQPTLVNGVINGRPVVRFDGVNDFLTFNLPVNGLSTMSLLLVAANTQNQNGGESGSERAALFWNETAGWGTVFLTPFQSSVNSRFGTTQVENRNNYLRPVSSGSSFTLSTAIKNGTTDSLYVNGTQVLNTGGKLPTIAGCQSVANVGRGYDNDTFFAGDIAEILIYNRALTITERQQAEQLLINKYGLTAAAGLADSPWITGISADRGNVRVNFSGRANGRYRVEASRDLILWTPVGTATAGPDGSAKFSHAADSSGARFYRVTSVP